MEASEKVAMQSVGNQEPTIFGQFSIVVIAVSNVTIAKVERDLFPSTNPLKKTRLSIEIIAAESWKRKFYRLTSYERRQMYDSNQSHLE